MKRQEKIKDDRINTQADALIDLPLTEGQAEETKAGGLSPYGNFTGGVRVASGE